MDNIEVVVLLGECSVPPFKESMDNIEVGVLLGECSVPPFKQSMDNIEVGVLLSLTLESAVCHPSSRVWITLK